MRLMAIGHRSLMDGFALLGMETHCDPSADEVEKILTTLSHSKEKAMIYLQQHQDYENLPILQQLRNEGGDILISEIPDILSAHEFHAPVDELISRVLGENVSLEVSDD